MRQTGDAVDTGIWNELSYEDSPAATTLTQKRAPRAVKEITTRATEVLTHNVKRDGPRARRKKATGETLRACQVGDPVGGALSLHPSPWRKEASDTTGWEN